MTIRLRNRLLKTQFFISIACIAILLICLIVALATNSVVPPLENRIPAFLNKLPFATYHFTAVLIAIGVLLLYVPAALFLLSRYFENTQSTEVIFFMVALIGFLCEGVRMLIPLFDLWKSYSQLLLLTGKIVIAGRIGVPLSFFCAAVFSETNQRQDIERNVMILLAVSVVIASGMPMNTAQITTTCAVSNGFAAVFSLVRVLIFLLTMLSFWINAHKHDSLELKKMTLYYAVLMIGYMFLLWADNFICLVLGTVALAAGTLAFLRNLHRLYKWK